MSAMAKIAAHVNAAKKFSKASKLALQLLEAGSVNSSNGRRFFEILERAMETPANSNDPTLREDYRALFSAAEERKNVSGRRVTSEWGTLSVTTVLTPHVQSRFHVLGKGVGISDCCNSCLNRYRLRAESLQYGLFLLPQSLSAAD